MKKILFGVMALATLILQSCSGPQGPMGIPGPQGEPGVNIIADVQEVVVPVFDAKNEYRIFETFNMEVYPTDKVLGYRLVGDFKGNDVWEPLPQTFFLNGNTYLYKFDFTMYDFSIFLDGNANLASIPLGNRSNQVFRMVVVPAEMVGKVNVLNYNDVVQKLKIKEVDFANNSISIQQ